MKDRYRALLIGNSSFKSREFTALVGPANDVQLLSQALVEPNVGLFSPDDVVAMTDCPASEISQRIEQFYESATRSDILLLYYSGHGVLDRRGNLYLCGSDSQLALLRSTAIGSRQLNEIMDDSPARRTIVVLDCCYSGAFKGGNFARPLAAAGRYVLSSCHPSELAMDAPSGTATSVFTSVLVEGLRHATGGPTARHITMEELHRYIRERMSRSQGQKPHYAFRGEGGLPIARRTPTSSVVERRAGGERAVSGPTRLRLSSVAAGVAGLGLLGTIAFYPPDRRIEDPAQSPSVHGTQMGTLPRIATIKLDPLSHSRGYSGFALGGTLHVAGLGQGDSLVLKSINLATGEQQWESSYRWASLASGKSFSHGVATTLRVEDGVALIEAQKFTTNQDAITTVAFDALTGRHLWAKQNAHVTPMGLKRAHIGYSYVNNREGIIDLRTGQMLWYDDEEFMATPLPRRVAIIDSTGASKIRGPSSPAIWMGDRRQAPLTGAVIETTPTRYRVREMATGKLASEARAPWIGITDSFRLEVMAFEPLMIVATISETGQAVLRGHDIRTGQKRWSTPAISNVFPAGIEPCSLTLVCVHRKLPAGGIVSAYEIQSGKLGWEVGTGDSIDTAREYSSLVFRDGRIPFIHGHEKTQELLLLDPQSGPVARESGVIRLADADRAVVLRGQIDGPELGSVEVRIMEFSAGTVSKVGDITTAAGTCVAAVAKLACAGRGDTINIYDLS